jgi:hypothetical protein
MKAFLWARSLFRAELFRAKRVAYAVLFLALVAASLAGQNAPMTIYAESFRHGATHVTEDKFEVKLTQREPTYREQIKDTYGNDRFRLSITPLRPGGDEQITSWRIELADLHHTIYNNVLLANQNMSADPKNNLWWLNPSQSASVPIRARRVVKVDSFYVVIQVKDFHFTPIESPYLDSMVVDFNFTNNDPQEEAH